MLFVGVMTGTSVDGLDLALVDLPNNLSPQATSTTSFPPRLRERLIALTSPGRDEVTRMGAAHVQLGDFIASACLDFLAQHNINASKVRAIGSHGQTIRHHPNSNYPHSVQIGSGHVIAERTGIDVVADFRSRDIAAGGQGAPLVPRYHDALFRDRSLSRVVLNVGGIANISILDPKNSASRGFDTGPGNALLDAWVQACRGEPYDLGGAWARSGKVHEPLLKQLLSDLYYEKTPPKSTGKEHFNLRYLQKSLTNIDVNDQADVQATLVELTAKTVTSAIDQYAAASTDVVVCGGGRLNDYLMARLQSLNSARAIRPSEALNIDGDAIEAAAFAYLAWQFVERLPGNEPAVTGADGLRVLGSLYPA